MNQPFLYFGPLKGLTDSLFREVFHRHFAGYDAAVAPFVNPQQKAVYDDKMLADLLPQNNQVLPVVPQLLNSHAADFLALALRLAELGYSEINWNLGCPVPMVAKKRRGSGLLPYPETINQLLSEVCPQLPVRLSIKTRLGYFDKSELETLLPQWASFPLSEIILHARLGKQLYRGSTDEDGFAGALQISPHPMAYNGDITSFATFTRLTQRFPQVNRWMMARGAIGNPFLAEEIKNMPAMDASQKRQRLIAFHEELFGRYHERLSGPGHLLGRVKQFWTYFAGLFPRSAREVKTILKARSIDQYLTAARQVISNSPLPDGWRELK